MKIVCLMMAAVAVLLAGCNRDVPQVPEVSLPTSEPSADLVDELAREPERLKEVRRLCRDNWDAVDEELCVAAAKATRQRFMGDGKAKYTPEPVALPEAQLPETTDE